MSDKAPTDAEVRRAEEVLERRAQAERDASDNAKRAVQEAFGDFAAVRDALKALPSDVRNHPNVVHNLDAIERGFDGIAIVGG